MLNYLYNLRYLLRRFRLTTRLLWQRIYRKAKLKHFIYLIIAVSGWILLMKISKAQEPDS